ncbi:acetyl esterase/lipase [Dyadobacter jejuensis]|uniref:Acetyl esterase/lipase n=1 Tax=Dyadobacter jejuensis TaxID=1082580 RepID=A0A316ALC7_9BACT|nr:alpha/beta hydrolase [Dyadobacter jejuensis]PWJ58322.1 acetyl esterase/lipase [Dyadobacter jejuensis]
MKTTIVNFRNDERIESETKKFLEALNAGGTALETLSKEEARQVLIGAQASIPVDLSGVDTSERVIESQGYQVKLHIVRPAGQSEALPAFMFIHGGGWILGDFPTHQRMVRDLVVQSGYVAIFVDYTPSPEALFPQAINEIYAATSWVAEHGDDINVDGSRLAIVGNSVGGNMGTVTTLMAKEKGGPKISLQVLFWPIVDSNFETASYQQFGEDRFLTTSLMKWMYDQYTTDAAERASIYAAPLRASTEQLQGLPPALIITAENDVLRDEAEAYGRKLNEAGVLVTTVRFNGMIHDFGLLNALSHIPAVESSFALAAAELRKHLG